MITVVVYAIAEAAVELKNKAAVSLTSASKHVTKVAEERGFVRKDVTALLPELTPVGSVVERVPAVVAHATRSAHGTAPNECDLSSDGIHGRGSEVRVSEDEEVKTGAASVESVAYKKEEEDVKFKIL